MIRRKIRRFVAALGVAVLPVVVAVPLGNCEGTLDVIVEGAVASPVIPLPPPGDYDIDGIDVITFPGYFDGQLLDAQDFRDEQSYNRPD